MSSDDRWLDMLRYPCHLRTPLTWPKTERQLITLDRVSPLSLRKISFGYALRNKDILRGQVRRRHLDHQATMSAEAHLPNTRAEVDHDEAARSRTSADGKPGAAEGCLRLQSGKSWLQALREVWLALQARPQSLQEQQANRPSCQLE